MEARRTLNVKRVIKWSGESGNMISGAWDLSDATGVSGVG